jgi:hypothetical protein
MLGHKRLQFNINVHPVNKFAPMKDLRAVLFPVLWVEEVRFSTECTNDIDAFYICGSVHHKSILLNNQHGAALLQGYSTCFGCFLHPSSGVQLKLQMES